MKETDEVRTATVLEENIKRRGGYFKERKGHKIIT
jgi:hypothetical protein